MILLISPVSLAFLTIFKDLSTAGRCMEARRWEFEVQRRRIFSAVTCFALPPLYLGAVTGAGELTSVSEVEPTEDLLLPFMEYFNAFQINRSIYWAL